MAKELRYQLNLTDYSATNKGQVYDVLTKIIHLTEHEISQLKFDGEILVNGERVRVNHHMQVSDILLVRFKDDKEQSVIDIDKLPDILYETEDFVVVNKPAGSPTHPSHNHLDDSTGTILLSYYQSQDTTFTVRPIGRLDITVSGVALYAKNQPAAARLNKEREAGKLKKIYIGFAEGHFDQKDGYIDAPLKKEDGKMVVSNDETSKSAITRYQVMQEREFNGVTFSILAITILTGRTHQIRAHMQAIGHSLLGDDLYGGNTEILQGRVGLHAAKMMFLSPFDEQKIEVQAPLPEDLRNLIENSTAPVTQEVTEDTIEATVPLSQTIEQTLPNEIVEEEKPVEKENKQILIDKKEAAIIIPTKKEQNSKKIILTILLILLFLGIGIGAYYIYWNTNIVSSIKSKFTSSTPISTVTPTAEVEEISAYDSLMITFKDVDSVNLNSTFDPLSIIESYTGDIKVIQTIDTSKANKQEVIYKLTTTDEDGKQVIRIYTKWITVKNVSYGATFYATSVTVLQGNEFDPKDNIESVYDTEGNELTYSETLKAGTYTIDDPVDTSKAGTYTVTITMMGNSEATSKASYEVIVKAKSTSTSPTIWIRKDSITVTKDTTYDVLNNVISVTDSDGNVLPYATSEKNGSYTISTTFTSKTVGTYDVQLIATDSNGNKAYDDWKIIVEEVKVTADTTAPTIWIYKDEITLIAGTTYDVASNVMSVTDDVDGKLPYSATEANGTYTIVTNFDNSKAGTYNVQLIAIDNAGNRSTDEWTITVKGSSGSSDTTAPYILIRYDSITIKAGSSYSLTSNVIHVTDAIDGTLSYSATEQNGYYTIVSDFDVNTPGTYNVQLIALDKSGNRSTDDWTVTVQEVSGADTTPPQIWIYQDAFTITKGANYRISMNIMSVTDDVDGALPYSDTEQNGSYTLVTNFDINTAGTYNVQLIATDRAGNKSYDDWTITVLESSGGNTSTSSNYDEIYSYLTNNMGLNRAAAIGIMANIRRESSYNPGSYNGSQNYGLCQWGGSRYRNLMSYCQDNGLDYTSVNGQMHYIEYELNGSYSGVLSQLQSVEDSADGAYAAGYIFAEQYEVAGAGFAEQSGETARSMY